jgi:hypothetical protein
MAKASNAEQQSLAEAIAYEAVIAEEAAQIRGDADALDFSLFMKLRPLLLRPIPSAFIQHVPKLEKGKPYESTGVRSVQVQISRMDNVLTPMWWWEQVDYHNDGKLAKVLIGVGTRAAPLVTRSSYGGVDRGSSAGNIYKGSYTNAAKAAFARIGPGHEVYLGAADLDPDVNEGIAKEQGGAERPAKQPGSTAHIGPQIAVKMVGRASHAAGGQDIGDCSTKKGAVEGLAGLTYEQAEKLDRWLARKETASEVDEAPAEGGDDD